MKTKIIKLPYKVDPEKYTGGIDPINNESFMRLYNVQDTKLTVEQYKSITDIIKRYDIFNSILHTRFNKLLEESRVNILDNKTNKN